MIRAAFIIARKDLSLAFGKGSGLVQAVLLGLLLIFVFSLSMVPGQRMSPQAAAAIFWMASAFCQVLIFTSLYAHEESNGQRQGLLLLPVPVQAVWLGKLLAGLALLFAAQIVFVPAAIVFLGQEITPLFPCAAASLVLTDIGAASLGSLLGALSQGRSARESLLSIIVFPLLVPLFLGGIRIGAAAFSGRLMDGDLSWLGLALAFDAVFLAAALVLFPFVYSGEE